jgi:hypothetical protein
MGMLQIAIAIDRKCHNIRVDSRSVFVKNSHPLANRSKSRLGLDFAITIRSDVNHCFVESDARNSCRGM